MLLLKLLFPLKELTPRGKAKGFGFDAKTGKPKGHNNDIPSQLCKSPRMGKGPRFVDGGKGMGKGDMGKGDFNHNMNQNMNMNMNNSFNNNGPNNFNNGPPNNNNFNNSFDGPNNGNMNQNNGNFNGGNYGNNDNFNGQQQQNNTNFFANGPKGDNLTPMGKAPPPSDFPLVSSYLLLDRLQRNLCCFAVVDH
jgi:hypothetical protein